MSESGRPRLAIVGVGLIGGSVGLAAKASGRFAEVVATDTNPSALADALEVGAVDRVTADLRDAVCNADLVVLSVPVPSVLLLFPSLLELLDPHAIVTDVGSVKGPVAAAGQSVLGARFVPGHPMAGSEKHGVRAARADLFQNATWAVTPFTPTTEGDDFSWAVPTVCEFAESLGAHPLLLDPEDHDRAVALTSHLPHLLAYALYASARAQGEESPVWQLAAGGFHSTTRVAASSPEMWAGICLANRNALLASLTDFSDRLAAFMTALESGDEKKLTNFLRAGHRNSV